MKTSLEIVREACVKANPNILIRDEDDGFKTEDKVRLADVLLTIGKVDVVVAVDVTGSFWRIGEQKLLKSYAWNLRQDNLEEQSEECLQFLGTLLS